MDSVSPFLQERVTVKKGVGTLISNQERRATVGLMMNRLRIGRSSAANQSRALSIHRFIYNCLCSYFRTKRSEQCFRYPGGREGRFSSGRNDPFASRLALQRAAQPLRLASPRLDQIINILANIKCRSKIVFLRHVLYEKDLQKQNGVGSLVSNRTRRALLVPGRNRGSNAKKKRIKFGCDAI